MLHLNELVKNVGWAIVGLLIFSQPLSAAERTDSPRLQGTFIQLWRTHSEWKPEDWSRLFEYFRQLRLSWLVIQWTVYEETAFYPSQTFQAVPNPPLETILQLADAAGMKVFVGLAHDPTFWEKIRRDPVLVEVYLRRLRLRSESAAGQLAPLVRHHPSFQGWYITEEIDDVNWRDPQARNVLFAYLQDVSGRLKAITPGGKVALSGFSNTQLDPLAFEEFWKALLEKASLDEVLFQDGIGVRKLQLTYLPLYLGAIRRAVDAHSRNLQVVVELFQQVNGKLSGDEPFKAVPAPLERITRQVALAAHYATSGVIAFSVPEYMTPLGGPEAEQLFTKYLTTTTTPH